MKAVDSFQSIFPINNFAPSPDLEAVSDFDSAGGARERYFLFSSLSDFERKTVSLRPSNPISAVYRVVVLWNETNTTS